MNISQLALPLAAAVICVFAQPASAAVLSRNDNLATGTGNGFNGANTSSISATDTTFGFSSNSAGATLSLADDFVLTGAALVTSVTFDAYSTSTYTFPPASPFTGATLSIWSAQPGTAGAAIISTSTSFSTAWTGIYRTQTTTLTNAQRPIMSLTMNFNNLPLSAGTYWASFAVTAVGAPGVSTSVFTPPVMNANGTTQAVGSAPSPASGLQSADGGVTWAAVSDATSLSPANFPLLVQGSLVPEPATYAQLAMGGALLLAFVRRRRAAQR